MNDALLLTREQKELRGGFTHLARASTGRSLRELLQNFWTGAARPALISSGVNSL